VRDRPFKTAAPVEDSATGWWNISPHFFGTVDSHSGPAGQNPRGSIDDVYAPFSYNAFKGSVTCLSVNGNRATVGAVGQQTLPDGQTTQPATLLLTVVDGGATGTDTLGRQQATGSTRRIAAPLPSISRPRWARRATSSSTTPPEKREADQLVGSRAGRTPFRPWKSADARQERVPCSVR
jgi:hypothetical protein